MGDGFDDILQECRTTRTSLRLTLATTAKLRMELSDVLRRSDETIAACAKQTSVGAVPLLRMAESLVDTHKAAKIDDDGYTLDLIEDALFHVGKRLAREHPDFAHRA